MKGIRASIIIVILILSSAIITTAQTVTTQQVQLQHHLIPGQAAQAKTRVKLSGDSLIGEENARTNLNIEMNRQFTVQNVNETGQAHLNMQVLEMRTNGMMNEEQFNETLTGERLQQTMFGASEMDVTVTPWGQVHASNPSMLKNLGIELPGEMSGGGFEFPSFPRGPVQVGSSWDENGILIQPNQTRTRVQQGEKVYHLKQLINTPQGRKAIIEYRKHSDLSGLGLGQTSELNQALEQIQQSGQLQGQQLPAGLNKGFQVPELTIQLEGEIHFNADYGVVTESHQRGTWNMSADFPILSNNSSSTRVNQKQMDIEIHTQFLWNSGEKITPPALPTPLPKLHIPPQQIRVDADNPES